MMSSRISFVLKHCFKRFSWNCRLCSTIPQATDERDPAPLFFDQHVQQLLTTLTRMDYQKIFAARKDGTRLEPPQYTFMTDDELNVARSQVVAKARGRIQMPPVVKTMSNKIEILSNDSALQGHEKCNMVFTDISFGGKNRERLVVVRDPNGILRHATCNERHRMNQIYFPISGRELHTPKMFFDPYFSDLLDRREFEFVLDRACLQFEPNDPEYHRVTMAVYSYVKRSKLFDALRSTRHFGPLAFHLAWEDDMQGLLLDLINSEHIEEAGALVRLYQKLHPEAKSAEEAMLDDGELIRNYARLDCPDRYALTLAMDKYEKLQEEKRKVQQGQLKAHGLIDDGDGEVDGDREGDGDGDGDGDGEEQPKT